MDSLQQRHVNDRHIFGILFAGYFLFILYPILRADRPCNDDLARAINGTYSWDINGRPLTTLLMRTLELHLRSMVDFSPLPQILAIALLALSGVLVARRYVVSAPWLAALLVLPLGAQPFFLENLSFRFDAPAMALAMLLALLPTTLIRQTLLGFWLGALCLFGCLCSYQPAFNVFLIFALLDLIARQAQHQTPRQLGGITCIYAGQAVTAIAVYEWKVAPMLGEWVQEHSKMIHSIHQFDVVLNNARTMGRYLLDAMPPQWMHALLPLIVLATIPPMVIGLRYALSSAAIRTRPIPVTIGLTIFAIALPFVAASCLGGAMLLLTSPVLMPRVFPSVGALISAGLIAWHIALPREQRRWIDAITFAPAAIWALSMLVFAGIYGNAAYAQQQYENEIASQLSNDLADLKAKTGIRQFLFDGSVGFSPPTAHAADNFHLLNTLILIYLRERDFNSRNFMKYYDVGLEEARQKPGSDTAADALLARACNAPVVYTRNRYVVRLVDDTAVVTFPGGSPASCPGSLPINH